MSQTNNIESRISIQVALSGYSFKIQDNEGERSSGWLTPDRIFTTPEFQKRYDAVKISLLTPKVALIPEQFFNPMELRQMLGDVVRLGEMMPSSLSGCRKGLRYWYSRTMWEKHCQG